MSMGSECPNCNNWVKASDDLCWVCQQLKNMKAENARLREALLRARWYMDNFPSSHLPGDKPFVTDIDEVNAACTHNDSSVEEK